MKGSSPIGWRRLKPLAGCVGFACLLLLGVSTDVVAQCSLCRDAVAASSPRTREAMNYAIIGLAFAPYGVAALAAWTLSPVVRARVRERLRRFSFGRRTNRP